MIRRFISYAAAAAVSWLCCLGTGRAQTDEIQVYTGEINQPGQFSVTLHNNYTPRGPRNPTFPGAVIPDHSLNGVPEYALGITDWLEFGAYLPLYSVTRDGRFLINGGKLRALFVAPQAAKRDFFYGVNFELSWNARHWDQAQRSLEVRPIVGWRWGKFDLVLNPIMDLPFHGGAAALTFAPATRVAYNLSPEIALAAEHYADFGPFSSFAPLSRQYHALFGVLDVNRDPYSFEFGVGHGFTAASESVILKLILSRNF